MNHPVLADINPGAGAASFERIARRVIRDAMTWARTLVTHGGHPNGGALEGVFRETLSFAAFLLTVRLGRNGVALSPVAKDELVASLRAEFDRALRRLRSDAGMPQGGPASNGDSADLGRQVAHYAAGDASGLGITPEMFARFCQVTGMHSTALVGSGSSLAQMFFYLRVFALVGADERTTLEQRKHLLRTAQRCREHFARLTENLDEPTADRAVLSTPMRAMRQIGARVQRVLPRLMEPSVD